MGGRLLVTQIRLKQAIIIRECKFEADLVVMPLKGLAVILGIDWMTSHEAQIDCERHIVSIRRLDGGRIVHKGDQRNQLEAELELNTFKEVKLEQIPIVNEFPDVFPQEFPGMPPDREIEFTIDFISGTAPITQPPYRMGPKELIELKE